MSLDTETGYELPSLDVAKKRVSSVVVTPLLIIQASQFVPLAVKLDPRELAEALRALEEGANAVVDRELNMRSRLALGDTYGHPHIIYVAASIPGRTGGMGTKDAALDANVTLWANMSTFYVGDYYLRHGDPHQRQESLRALTVDMQVLENNVGRRMRGEAEAFRCVRCKAWKPLPSSGRWWSGLYCDMCWTKPFVRGERTEVESYYVGKTPKELEAKETYE